METTLQSETSTNWDNSLAIVCDRHLADHFSQGYCLSLVDKTSFTSSEKVLFGRFDCSKLFIYSPTNEIAVDSIPVKVLIFEKQEHTSAKSERIVFEGYTNLQSHSEAHISISPPTVIYPEFKYEIQIHTPPDELYLYNEVHTDRDFDLNDGRGETIRITTCGHNEFIHSRSVNDQKRCISAGVVKRLHFNRM